jgi:hypothetical protein
MNCFPIIYYKYKYTLEQFAQDTVTSDTGGNCAHGQPCKQMPSRDITHWKPLRPWLGERGPWGVAQEDLFGL